MMRKIILLLLTVIFLPVSSFVQNGWNWVSTPVDSIKRHIWDVHFFSPDTGWILGQIDVEIGTHELLAFTPDGGIS